MFLLSPSIFWWDLSILLLISIALCMMLMSWLWYRRNRTKHGLAKTCVLLVAATGAAGLILTIYGSFIEPQMIVITEHSIALRIEEPLRVVVISDIQVGPYKGAAFLSRVVDKINQTIPDIVLIAGDIIEDERSNLSSLEPLGSIRASAGVFAVLGNHDRGHRQNILGQRIQFLDRGEDVEDALEELNVQVLRNEHIIISLGAENINLVGIDDLWSGDSDLSSAMTDMLDLTTILLSHNPDIIKEEQSNDADLIVAGHTHGGQLRLPYIGALSTLPTTIGPSFDQGVFTLDKGSILALTRGVGEASLRARLFAWPEVMVLNLTPLPPPST